MQRPSLHQMLMTSSAEQIMMSYAEAYQKLYQRAPKDLRAIDNNWVVVNGARMSITELQFLTERLQQEYRQAIADRKGVVSKLIRWFRG